jgi:hypothetical protein
VISLSYSSVAVALRVPVVADARARQIKYFARLKQKEKFDMRSLIAGRTSCAFHLQRFRKLYISSRKTFLCVPAKLRPSKDYEMRR